LGRTIDEIINLKVKIIAQDYYYFLKIKQNRSKHCNPSYAASILFNPTINSTVQKYKK